ncbi:MAG: T9SS type A sorting domain-containing protein [Bacteroidetes bacterium]|nr:T9SS type A sorting domain-containing protein [Bacteroidota bacterium]MBL7104656.1 T9SS type A sorting domain-containing protein [Bacteroidales bacterium]
MKKLVFAIVLMLGVTGLFAGNGYDVSFNQPANDVYELNFNLDNYEISQVTINGVTYSDILFDGSVFTQLKGFAQLPFINASVRLSEDKNVTLKVIEGEYVEYSLEHPMLPSRGVIYRDQDPSTIPYEISPGSFRDEWYPQNLANNTSPFIIKDLRGTTVYVYPFRYNAVRNVLRVYQTVTVQLIENETPAVNPLEKEPTTVLREMNGIYKSLFVNYELTKDDLTIGEYGDILVICTDRDETAIQPYIDWKKEKGYNVTKEVVATGTNVKTNVQNAYNANINLLYIQLVGDWADIKCDLLSGYAPMDPQLGCVAGNDDYPDICVGRISANSPADVTAQVDKIINYEKNPETGGAWYNVATGIASNQGPGDDGEDDYEHLDVIWNDKLDPFTYDSYNPIYDPSANITMVNNAVNGGTSIINYTGHGSPTSWGTSGFSNSNVAALTNGDMLPWIVSVACNNGDFHTGTCFAEAWARKNDGGAIMFLGATISQPWDPPMRGQDYFMDVFIGGYDYSAHPGQNGISTTEQRTTLGAIIFNGLVLMTTEAGSSSDWNTAKTWTMFGDPSTQPRSDVPGTISLSNETVMAGIPFATIVSGPDGPFEGAMVCLSMNDEYFSGVTDATGSVSIDHTLTPGTAKMVVTGFNLETIYQDVIVASSNQAWIIVENYEIDDSNGNNNGQADYAESVLLNVSAENVGSFPAVGVDATLSTTDQYITITDNSYTYGDIGAGQIVNGDGAFAIDVAQDAPDGHSAIFEVEFTDGNKDSWTSTIIITLHAPVMDLGDYTISDPTGNNNNKIDPGETVNITIQILNDGSSPAYNVIGDLTCPDPYITVIQGTQNYGDINGGGSQQQAFTVSADINTPVGHAVTFEFAISADLGISASGSFLEVVGQIPVLILDMDDNHNSGTIMQQAIANNDIVAEYVTSFPPDLNLYSSIFLCLGIYSNNHTLTSDEGQTLANYLNDGGNLYMEGGDTWCYDNQTAVHSMFNINPAGDGSSDMSVVVGQTGTFTEGMSFNYSGENSYMDHIDANAPAFLILENQSPVYGTGVAYDAGTYKTIGTSHEFGGLDDATSPSTKEELMAAYLDFFGFTTTLQALFAASAIEICEGDIIDFYDMSTGDVISWEWIFEGGAPGSSSFQNPSVMYATAGTYDVTLTVSDGVNNNTLTLEDYIIVNTCSEIVENIFSEISLYPNPNNGIFTLELNSEVDDDVNIKILNSLGAVVYEKGNIEATGNFKTTIDLSELYKGLYFLVIENYQGRTVKRIIIR